MLTVIIAFVLLIVAIGAIYVLLKNMGEEGIEVAAPGSCKSGGCGVRRATVTETHYGQEGDLTGEDDEARRKETV